jgi:protein-tyrosine-phosphatase
MGDRTGPQREAADEAPIRVLFLCTQNSARSQIAEALLGRKGGARFSVASAGVQPARTVHPEAIAALARAGIDWSAARPKDVSVFEDVEWDMIITTCDRIREHCPSFPGQPIYAHWGVPDPVEAERGAAAFDETVALLAWRLDLMLALPPASLQDAAAAARLRRIASRTPGATPTDAD